MDIGVSGVVRPSVASHAGGYMNTRDASKTTSSESTKDEKGHPFVVPENEIRDYVENLGVHDIGIVAARFQIVADLTKKAVDQLDQPTLRRIKALADEDGNKHYRRIMEAIIVGTGQGSRGINAAHLTARVAVQMIFRWSPEYFSALNSYREHLRSRKISLLDRHSSRRTRRSVLRVAND